MSNMLNLEAKLSYSWYCQLPTPSSALPNFTLMILCWASCRNVLIYITLAGEVVAQRPTGAMGTFSRDGDDSAGDDGHCDDCSAIGSGVDKGRGCGDDVAVGCKDAGIDVMICRRGGGCESHGNGAGHD